MPQQKDQSIVTEKSEADYVLGTNDEELDRLGLQHRVWRPVVTECWQRVGITHGWRVLDVGAGPGYATADLAEIVGPTGSVLGVERSARFLEAARERCRRRGLTNVEFREADLMEVSLGQLGFDASWCRWVASFVSSPKRDTQRRSWPSGLATAPIPLPPPPSGIRTMLRRRKP